MLIELWTWWQGTGTPAAAAQQLAFIFFTAVATLVGIVNLSAWKRQQRASIRAAAVKDLLEAASLLSDHILIERLSSSPMVSFSNLNGFDTAWQAKALARIRSEHDYWHAHKAELNNRLTSLHSAMGKNFHLLGSLINGKVSGLVEQVNKYSDAIDKRVQLISACARKNTEDGYRPMISLVSLSKHHPLLWRKERNPDSIAFEGEVRRALDALRSALVKIT